jgi:hypothetical protein
MKPGDLTTLATAKVWLGIPIPGSEDTGASDALLTRLISSASGVVLSYLGRTSLGATDVVETYDGFGGDVLVLRQWPVNAIASIEFDGRSDPVPEAVNGASGWRRAQDGAACRQVSFHGFQMPDGRQSVTVTYNAGYRASEARELPEAADGAQTVSVTAYFCLVEDFGVTIDGVAQTRVKTGTPGTGEYKLVGSTYQFPAAIEGEAVVLDYSYVPAAIEDAVIQMVGTKFKAKDNIGVSSKTLGGQETVVFDKRDLSQSIKDVLQPYRRVV